MSKSKHDQVPVHTQGHDRKMFHNDGSQIARPHPLDTNTASAAEVLADHGKPGKTLPLAAPHPDTLTRPLFDKAGRPHARSHGTDPNLGPAIMDEACAHEAAGELPSKK